MKAFIAVLALAAVANAGVLVAPSTISRVPSLDSAVIQSDRIGGNFAYSVSEAHAHAVSTPIIQHVAHPVAVTHSVPVVQQQLIQQVVPQQIVQHVAVPQQIVQQVAVPQVAGVRTISNIGIAGIAGLRTIGSPAGTILLK